MSSPKRIAALASLATLSAAAFAALAVAVARNRTHKTDERLLEEIAPPEDHPARRAAELMTPFGKSWMYLPLTGVCAGMLLATTREARDLPSRGVAILAVAMSGSMAGFLNPRFDDWLPQPEAPPGREDTTQAVFPSGHAFGPGAITLSAAYVLSREAEVPMWVTLPLASVVPLTMAGARLVEAKHWASDVAGGFLTAIALSAVSLIAYEAIVPTRR